MLAGMLLAQLQGKPKPTGKGKDTWKQEVVG